MREIEARKHKIDRYVLRGNTMVPSYLTKNNKRTDYEFQGRVFDSIDEAIEAESAANQTLRHLTAGHGWRIAILGRHYPRWLSI